MLSNAPRRSCTVLRGERPWVRLCPGRGWSPEHSPDLGQEISPQGGSPARQPRCSAQAASKLLRLWKSWNLLMGNSFEISLCFKGQRWVPSTVWLPVNLGWNRHEWEAIRLREQFVLCTLCIFFFFPACSLPASLEAHRRALLAQICDLATFKAREGGRA